MINQLYWDLETTGKNTKFSSICSVHMELVNDTFQSLDKYSSFCSLRPGVIPEIGAVLVTGLTPKILQQKNKSHFQMVKEIHHFIKSKKPVIMSGWNNILYDSMVLESAFYQCLLPVYVERLEGNRRHDLLSTARATSVFDPKKINYPFNEKNLPFFKLEDVCKANNVNPEGDFHSSEVDVKSTIHIGKLIAEKCPLIWKSALLNLTKHEISNSAQKEKMFSTFESFYGRIHPKLVTWLCTHKTYKYELAWDLAQDPQEVIDLMNDYSAFKKAISAKPKKIRTIRPNRSQIILHPEQAQRVEPYSAISINTLNSRVNLINKNRERLTQLIDRINEEKVLEKQELDDQLEGSLYPEETIYPGSIQISKKDEKLMQDFHSSNDWNSRVKFIDKFDSQNFNWFCKRLIYDESPSSLSKEQFNEIHREIAKRLFSENEEKFVTIKEAQHQIDEKYGELEDTGNDDKIKLLREVDEYVDKVKKIYQEA